MRRLTLAMFLFSLALTTSPASLATASRVRQCPTVKISCPDAATAGMPITFTAEISGPVVNSNVVYNWTVSAGLIISGQGTSSITIETEEIRNGSVEATAQVSGLPEGCPMSASCASNMSPCRVSKVDEYSNIPSGDEKARLDNFTIELRNNPMARGYLICYGGSVGRAGEGKARCDRAKNYLVTLKGLADERIITVDGGYKATLTVELWISPLDATPPTASPTVDPREVKIIKSKRKPRKKVTSKQ